MNAKFLAIVFILSGLFVAADKSYGCIPPPPTAVLTDYPDPVLLGDSVTLDGTGSTGAGGIIKYEWDWTNDGIYDYNETPGDGKAEYTYPSPGTYTAKLRVTEGYYLHRTDTDTCTVHVVRVKNITKGTGYSTIQAAINDANNADEIIASKGTYYEAVDFKGKAITVRGTDPNDWTVIAATTIDVNDPNACVVTFATSEDANSVIRGFTITGGDQGIYCDETSPTISNCVVSGNKSGQ